MLSALNPSYMQSSYYWYFRGGYGYMFNTFLIYALVATEAQLFR